MVELLCNSLPFRSLPNLVNLGLIRMATLALIPGFGSDNVGEPPDRPWFGRPYTAPDPPSGSIPNRLFGSNSSTRFSDLLRFAETPRLQYARIPDSRGAWDFGTARDRFFGGVAFPNFLNTERPIYVAPSLD